MQAGESEDWVRVLKNDEFFYSWNRRTGAATRDEVDGTWAAKQDEASGSWYYWKTTNPDQPVWRLPDPDSSKESEPEIESTRIDCEPPVAYEQGVTEVWRKIMADTPYYWHSEKQLILDQLPPGVTSRWIANWVEDTWVYEDTGARSSQEPLPSTSPWIEIGSPVCLSGLTKKAHFNWQIGTLVDILAGWYLLRLADSAKVFSVRPRNVEQLLVGSLVELQRLSDTELNGRLGVVVGHNFEVVRYHVELGDGIEKAVKGVNLKPKSRLCDLNARLGVGTSSPSYLQWRGEQQCLFYDKQGRHRTYALHLPIGFDPTPQACMKRWPLIVYLHGTGGGSFFTYSKKSLKTPGMQCAARSFVVVSPRCEWTWREEPSGWIAELVKALRVLDWIDHQRVYLTGCSMGGMGAWEVGSQSADLFAAVCPVAAHHKNERTALIANGLRSTPLYVVHADTDDTCPMSQEEGLWRLLEDCHQDFTKVVLHNVDHCSIHEHAYCYNEEVYRWLLQRTICSA